MRYSQLNAMWRRYDKMYDQTGNEYYAMICNRIALLMMVMELK